MKKSLFGYGVTTKALAKFQIKEGQWDIYDDHFDEPKSDEFGNNLLPPSFFDADKSMIEIPSPGFPPTHNLVKKAKNLISEYDYFFPKMPPSIWISGTNGKTTTTQMTQFLLASCGSQMGGNVGTPLACLDISAKLWILETSSFTLHYTKKAYPHIYLLLPITPDHLSWHGSMSDYIEAKLKPLTMMGEGDVAVVPYKFKDFPTNATIIPYKDEEDLAKFCNIKIEDIAFKSPFLLDSLLALSAQKIIFDNCNVLLLNKFKIEKNKLEEIRDRFDRLWVNDTKATNIDAAFQAIKCYKDKKTYLILGGDDKGVDLNSFFKDFTALNKNIKIYAIGSNCEKIMNLCDKFGLVATKCEFLKIAVEKIAKELQVGEVGLLSPACASLDQYSSYIKRGEEFKNLIGNL
ncbi:UDP-N-acetylmuramoyl-L-alanine--D-glutamate ligase [uncultured Campylobacter sp.]|uniref:UDP-N-acetylmuramoyl-L-alanine--D-glutamate ligase n=1 Tax=uncultured Campylobacter sp. TaxID=218934 RepID=UPI00261E15F1|nr:UDP-N-acetylmuramoyl-L-alanine--D-glutamate ligase [uncultured Campylobacter sp.]